MPLRRWLSIWANGGDVWDDVLAEEPREGEASDGGGPEAGQHPGPSP
jgi:hypothetical protein